MTTESVSDYKFASLGTPLPVDASSQRRICKTVPASAGASATIAQGGLRGNLSTFSLASSADSRLNLVECVLNVEGVFSAASTALVALPCNAARTSCQSSVPWNLFGLLIAEVNLSINGTLIYSESSPGGYAMGFTSRMLRYYDMKTLNCMDSCLFTPLTMPGSTDDSYIATGVPAANSGSLTCGNIAAAERATKYCINSDRKPWRLCVSFADLFPRIQSGILHNVKTVDLTIRWTASNEVMERITVPGQLVEGGDVSSASDFAIVLNASVATSEYLQSSGEFAQNAAKRAAGYQDIINMVIPSVRRVTIDGSSISIPGIKNFDSIMLLSPCLNVLSDAASITPYASSGQLHLCNLSTGNANLIVQRSDYQDAATADYSPSISFIRTLSLSYGALSYPLSPLTFTLTNPAGLVIPDLGNVYRELHSSTGRIGDRRLGPIMARHELSTLPYIFIRPYSDNGVHLSESQSLQLDIACNPANPLTRGNTMFLIIYTIRQFTVDADDNVREVIL